jgi:hypothetical protein
MSESPRPVTEKRKKLPIKHLPWLGMAAMAALWSGRRQPSAGLAGPDNVAQASSRLASLAAWSSAMRGSITSSRLSPEMTLPRLYSVRLMR